MFRRTFLKYLAGLGAALVWPVKAFTAGPKKQLGDTVKLMNEIGEMLNDECKRVHGMELRELEITGNTPGRPFAINIKMAYIVPITHCTSQFYVLLSDSPDLPSPLGMVSIGILCDLWSLVARHNLEHKRELRVWNPHEEAKQELFVKNCRQVRLYMEFIVKEKS